MAVPKGIRTRPTPDWYAQWMSVGAFYVPFSDPTAFKAISLFNNSTQGYYLFVFSLIATNDLDNVTLGAIANGSFGVKQSDCTRVNPSMGAPAGQIFYLNNAATPFALPIQAVYPGGVGANVWNTGPMHIIPPGYSLVTYGGIAVEEIACSFWYCPMRDLSGRTPG